MMLSKALLVAAGAAIAFSLSAAVPRFDLRDTVGAAHTPAEWEGYKAVVLFFVTTDCPIGNSYVPEMNRIHDEYGARGVLVWGVQAETTTDASTVARYAQEYRYRFPLLLDPRQVLVEMTGATITPQAAILSPAGRLYYLGRIDNRVADFGKQRPQATERDLRDALDEVLAGKPVTHPTAKSVGCAINRRR
jgi:peroxiredoxin